MRVSWILSVALVAAVPLAVGQDGDKPSPVPSRMRKEVRVGAADAPVRPGTPDPAVPARREQETWDGRRSGTSVYFASHGSNKASASGEVVDPEKDLVAAHATLPFGSLVKVTNTKNGKEVTVRIVDRISSGSAHIISVSERAADELDFKRDGVGFVRIAPENR